MWDWDFVEDSDKIGRDTSSPDKIGQVQTLWSLEALKSLLVSHDEECGVKFLWFCLRSVNCVEIVLAIKSRRSGSVLGPLCCRNDPVMCHVAS